ncbi:MAG: ABC transporter permease [Saprospiraceae bacterium]|nr:ABC transporter permease [Saprospiraceae bacterium]
MYKRALLLSIRQLLQQKGYALVHVLGIAVGFASCCIIVLYVQHEYTYDRFFERSADIYKMVERSSSAQEDQVKATVPYTYARVLEDQYPEVEVATTISGPYNNQNISIPIPNGKRRNFLEKAVFLADSNFLSVFNWKLLAGDRKTALVAPNSIVLTEATAKRYFGDIDPLGKTIKIGHRNSTVTAICETPPKHSHFAFNYLVSSSTVAWYSQDEFSLRTAHCYLKLRPDIKPASVAAKFPSLVDQFFLPAIKKLQEVNGTYKVEETPIPNYQLKPLHALHLDPDQAGSMKPAGNRQLLQFLLLIAGFIFLMAGINYLNLSTIQSSKRDKEIAVSKIIGANKGQIMLQFLMRSTVLAGLGVGLGLIVVQIALPYFNSFLGVELNLCWSWLHLVFYTFLILGVGLSAGLYPAIKLSSIAPITLYNPRISRRISKLSGRDALMIFQFSVAIMLLIATFVIHQQRSLLAQKDLGFDQEEVLVLEGSFARDPAGARPFSMQ